MALVNYHTAQMRKVSNRLGKLALEFRTGRDLKRLHDAAKEKVQGSAARGRELLAIVKGNERESRKTSGPVSR